MAIVSITTTSGAIPPEDRPQLAAELARLTYAAEGFGDSALAPKLTWTFFDERPSLAFSTGAGEPAVALYYLQVTTLSGALDGAAKQQLSAGLTSTILAREGCPPVPENLNRIWVRFMDVADGDLVVGGESTSLSGLKALVAQAG